MEGQRHRKYYLAVLKEWYSIQRLISSSTYNKNTLNLPGPTK